MIIDINVSINKENMENMSDGRKRILSPFIGHKKRKAWNKTGVKCMSD